MVCVVLVNLAGEPAVATYCDSSPVSFTSGGVLQSKPARLDPETKYFVPTAAIPSGQNTYPDVARVAVERAAIV